MGTEDLDDLEKSDILYMHMNNYMQFTECEQRIYRMITWLEQEINLETLVKIKKSIFVPTLDEDTSKQFPFFQPLPESYTIPGLEALK